MVFQHFGVARSLNCQQGGGWRGLGKGGEGRERSETGGSLGLGATCKQPHFRKGNDGLRLTAAPAARPLDPWLCWSFLRVVDVVCLCLLNWFSMHVTAEYEVVRKHSPRTRKFRTDHPQRKSCRNRKMTSRIGPLNDQDVTFSQTCTLKECFASMPWLRLYIPSFRWGIVPTRRRGSADQVSLQGVPP